MQKPQELDVCLKAKLVGRGFSVFDFLDFGLSKIMEQIAVRPPKQNFRIGFESLGADIGICLGETFISDGILAVPIQRQGVVNANNTSPTPKIKRFKLRVTVSLKTSVDLLISEVFGEEAERSLVTIELKELIKVGIQSAQSLYLWMLEVMSQINLEQAPLQELLQENTQAGPTQEQLASLEQYRQATL